MTNSGNNDLYRCRRILWPREDQYLASWNPGREALAKCYRKRCNEIINYAINVASSKRYAAFKEEIRQIREDRWFSQALSSARLTGRFGWYGKAFQKKRDFILYLVMRAEERLVRLKKRYIHT